jgi:hypothetical protein
MWAFSAIRKVLESALAPMNSPQAVQYDCLRGGIPRTGRCSNRGLDFEGMGFWKVLRIVTRGLNEQQRNSFVCGPEKNWPNQGNRSSSTALFNPGCDMENRGRSLFEAVVNPALF